MNTNSLRWFILKCKLMEGGGHMDEAQQYEAFLRQRITDLRTQKNVSEHRMSLDLGKSGSYIRSITNGVCLPSLRELFNIIRYFGLTPTEFFIGSDGKDAPRDQLREKILELSDEDVEKVSTFLDWIRK